MSETSLSYSSAAGQPRINLAEENLRRDEAAERAQLLLGDGPHAPGRVRIEAVIDISAAQDLSARYFPVETTLHFPCQQPGASTFIDFINAGVDEVMCNGRSLDVAKVAGPARILVDELAEENTVVIRGKARYSTSGEGMHRYQDPADGKIYLYTQYEPADARRVFACFEQPDIKAEFSFTLIGPSDWVLASNTDAVSSEEDSPGITRVRFAPTQTMSSYITTLLAGPYTRFSDEHRGIAMNIFTRASLAQQCQPERIFSWTKRGLDFFEEYFDYPYPWGKYDQAFVPEYNLGAMENPGLVTFNDQLVFEPGATRAQWNSLAEVLMHEMSHMWFGDLVTMKWWDDLWLKESFADFMGTFALVEAIAEFHDAWVGFAVRRKAWAYVQDELPTTHPIVADIPDLEAANQNFDGITYAKGASVVKQLGAYVGREAFREAARTYFRRFAWGNTTLADFLQVLSEASGKDMQAWAEAWLQTTGVQTLSYTGEQIQLSTPATAGAPQPPRPHTLQLARYDTSTTPYRRAASTRVEFTGTELELPEQLRGEGLLIANDEDLSYVKLRFSEEQLPTALAGLSDDELSNATVWAGLWGMVRHAELCPEDYAQAVLKHGINFRPISLLTTVQDNLVTVLKNYTTAQTRQHLATACAERILPLLSPAAAAVQGPAATDGAENSDRVDAEQATVLARTLVAVACYTDAADEWLQQLVATGHEEYLGEVIVTDTLRWAAIAALTERGHYDAAQLEAFHQQRRTTHTQLGFARAMAARPDAAAKAAAWEQIFHGNLSNAVLTATITGFQSGPEELLVDYQQRFFDWIERAWQEHSMEIATRMVEGLYPTILTAGNTAAAPTVEAHGPAWALQAGKQWIVQHPHAPAALRRVVIEHHALLNQRAQVLQRWP